MIEILECEVDLLTDELSVVTELGVISEWGGKQLYHCPSCGTVAESFYFRCEICNKATCYHCGFMPDLPNQFDTYCPEHRKELRNVVSVWLQARRRQYE
mgnify:FL=1